ncbi:MAG: sugar ABC transporter ATP-binding protein [Ancalomicrobiaceae bacterium]|nr:sugar ABC transporter ATP-binding protein [Ancalomicrobiaceae bacterium]
MSKHFGGARALSGVTLDVGHGEVHGLLGQNGSGKSTLIKILAGFHEPDPGARLWIGGVPMSLPLAPADIRKAGIAFVHQHLGLVPSLTVLENLLAGEYAVAMRWFINWRAEARKARELFRRFGLSLDPLVAVERLSSVERALLAIVRAFMQLEAAGAGARLLVLDEPTPFLPAEDVGRLFHLVRGIVAEGASVIFVSHDIDEVIEITDRITVLRDGRLAGSLVTAEADKAEIVTKIVGRAVDLESLRPPVRAFGPDRAVIADLAGRGVKDFYLRVRAGEVVGLTGLIGSGYDDVVTMIFGTETADRGYLAIDRDEFDLATFAPHEAIKAGIVFIPGDRLNQGVVATLTVTENVNLPVLDRFNGGFFLSRSALRRRAEALNEALDVRPRNPDCPIGSLSGGNQQKVVLSKWFQMAPKLVLLEEPTQGVDVGAREQVFAEIHKMAVTGAAIVCASSDHEQLAAICDRVLVLAKGRVVASLEGAAISKAAIAESCYLSLDVAEGVGL